MKDIHIIQGPRTASISREEAERELVNNPSFPKGASYTLDDVDGRWVAAISLVKKAAFPFDDSGDSESEAPKEKPDPVEDSSEGSESEAPKEEKPKGDSGLAEIKQMLTTLLDALGLSDQSGMGAEGEVAPPHKPDHPTGPDGKTHTVYERALKPGEAPPGSTPVGTPAFAAVREDHPWKDELQRGSKAWTVMDEIGNDTISTVAKELISLAKEAGCKIEDLTPHEENGRRYASAKVVQSQVKMSQVEEELIDEWFDRIRGRLCGLVESWGLPQRQERAMISTLKSLTYDFQNDLKEL